MTPKKDPRPYLEHILESIDFIQNHIKNISKEKFLDSIITQDAVIRRFEIIGEAARNIDPELKTKFSNVPWRKIIDMRNILIHQYFEIDLDQTWDTIQKDLPTLGKQIKEILSKTP